jgi:hypothetical protein
MDGEGEVETWREIVGIPSMAHPSLVVHRERIFAFYRTSSGNGRPNRLQLVELGCAE